MAIRQTVIEEDVNDPTVVRKTNTIVNPDIHTQVVNSREEVVDSADTTEVRQTKTIHEPLVKTGHPQQVYETKKAIFKSWQVIWFILAAIEVLLGLRMTFKAIGANELSGFVSFIYNITDILVGPFARIVPSTVNGASVIEWSTIIAAIIYGLIAWGIVSLIHIARPVTPEEIDHAV